MKMSDQSHVHPYRKTESRNQQQKMPRKRVIKRSHHNEKKHVEEQNNDNLVTKDTANEERQGHSDRTDFESTNGSTILTPKKTDSNFQVNNGFKTPEKKKANEQHFTLRTAANDTTTSAATTEGTNASYNRITSAQLWVQRILLTHQESLQKLGLAIDAFPSTCLSTEQLEILIAPVIALCDRMTPEQFGIHPPTPSMANSMKEVHYWKLWESDTIDLGIFFMPPNSIIPLHNHPGMSVVSRILYGSVTVKSYDVVPAKELGELAKQEDQNIKWAELTREGKYAGISTMWLEPNRHNLHEIEANCEIGCALLDIMIPPYDNADRDCHHYQVVEEVFIEKLQKKVFKLLESISQDNHNSTSSASSSTTTSKSTKTSSVASPRARKMPVVDAPTTMSEAS